jgi:hypothetical protein
VRVPCSSRSPNARALTAVRSSVARVARPGEGRNGLVGCAVTRVQTRRCESRDSSMAIGAPYLRMVRWAFPAISYDRL